MKHGDSVERIKRLGITAWSLVGAAVLSYIIIYIFLSISAVLMPFLIALLFVYILRPVVNFLEDKGLPRVLALLLSYVGLILSMVLLSSYVGPILYNEGNGLVKNMPRSISIANGYVNDLVQQHPILRGDQATEFLKSSEKWLTSFLQQIVSKIPTITATIFGSVLNFVLGPIIAFYLLKDLKAIRSSVRDMIPLRHRAEGMDIVNKIDCIVGGFLKGQLLVALSVGVLSGIALSVLGVDYAILLGFLIGAFNVVPYLGPIIGGTPAIIIALGTSWQLALIVVVVLIVVQQIDSVFISPRIMSSQVNLHPTVVIFAILAGGTFLGILGMLIAIPLAAVGKALYLHFRERGETAIDQPELTEMQQPAKV